MKKHHFLFTAVLGFIAQLIISAGASPNSAMLTASKKMMIQSQVLSTSGMKDVQIAKSPDGGKLLRFAEQSSENAKESKTHFDILHWVHSGTPTKQDVLEKEPQLAEHDIEGTCGQVEPSGKYASPFNPQVRAILRNTVTNLASSTRTSSLLLRCRLPRTAILGYSDSARLAYINAKSVDPIDIRFGTGDAEEEKLAQDWISWRLASVASLVKSLSTTYKTKKPTGKVAVMGSADWTRMTRGQKNTTLEDWPTWAASGLIDEIVLEGDWNVPQGRTDYAASKAALDLINAKLQAAPKTKRAPIKLTVLIPLRDTNGRALDPLSQLLTLQGQGVKSIMLQVSDASDLPRANEFISQTLPSVQAMLQ